MSKSRIYSGSDVAMLTVCSVIVDHAIEDAAFLSGKRPVWKSPYFEDLKKKIEEGFAILGLDKASKQRQATLALLWLQRDALTALSEVKVQIEEDFKQEKVLRDELLNSLGFTSFYRQVLKKDQNALIELLYRFKENLTDAFRTLIVGKGTAAESLDKVVAYAEQMKAANVSQETLKGDRKVLTEKDAALLNDIYSTVISVARIAHRFYRGDAAKQEEYSYAKIRSRLSFRGGKTAEEGAEE